MNQLLVALLMKIAEKALLKLSEDEELQDNVLLNMKFIADWVQEKLGKVSKHDLEEAIQIALNSSIKRDKDTICKILSVITALYAVEDVRRGAVTGGTLLRHFGSDVFPHIDQRELRFAKNIDERILSHISESVESEFDSSIKSYQLKEYASFEGVNSATSSMVWDTGMDKHFKFVMKNSHKVFKTIKAAFSFPQK